MSYPRRRVSIFIFAWRLQDMDEKNQVCYFHTWEKILSIEAYWDIKEYPDLNLRLLKKLYPI